MELSFSELAVLAATGINPKSREQLAKDAATLYPSTKFDAMLALAEIRTLEERRFLEKDKLGKLSLTRLGHAQILQAIPVIENLRAYVATAGYRSQR